VSGEWKLVLDEEVLSLLLACRAPERRQLLQALDVLRLNPFQRGDYTEKDNTSRELQVKVFGRFLISYWPDSFVSELRIVDIERIRSSW